MNVAAVAPPCARCGGSSWLGVMNPCPDCQGNACGLCGARAVVVWHLTAEGALVDSEARCWQHRHLRRDAITSRERLREACAAMCDACEEDRSDFPAVARLRGNGWEGWHHVAAAEDSEEVGFDQGRCAASDFRDHVDPKGDLEGVPASDVWAECPCPCHELSEGLWVLNGECARCEGDFEAEEADEQLDNLLVVQIPGRCRLGGAQALVSERDRLLLRCAEQAAELERLREILKEIDGRRIEADAEARRLRSAGERLQADLARLRRLVDTDDVDDMDEGE